MKKTILSIILLIAAGTLSCYDGLLETRNKTYKLRDIGPAGGYIFYINPNYEEDGWRYLEAAPSDQGSAVWGQIMTIPGADGTAIGTGRQNTLDIVNGDASANKAADFCKNLSLGGYKDWFLPSKDELDLMCWNLHGIRYNSSNPPIPIVNPDVPNPSIYSFGSNNYWSSSEIVSTTVAWSQSFIDGSQNGATNKGNGDFVRPIRAF